MLRLDGRRFILRSDVAAINQQSAFGPDADEDTGAGDLGWSIDDRAILEGRERRLDLAEPLVDFVREFIDALVFGFELSVFGVQRADRRLLLGGQIGRHAVEFAQTTDMAVRKLGRNLDPFCQFPLRFQ